MKLFLIIGEDHFYHPTFVESLIKQTKDQIVGAAVVKKAPKKADLQSYLIKHFYYLKPLEIAKLAFSNITHLLRKNSVESVIKRNKIDFFIVDSNINDEKYLQKIREKDPDVIISSNPWIFKEDLLNMPQICCINRHSSLLPSYGGLWPVFYAVVNNEKETGVTVHTMVKEIDKGIILAQRKVGISDKDTISDLYKKTFEESVPAVLEALDKIRERDFKPTNTNYKISYFSFPTKEDWRKLRELHRKFI